MSASGTGTQLGMARTLIEYLGDWERRYGCPAPTAALAQDLALSADRLALLLARLESAGSIRRVPGSLGALDVALVGR